MNSPKFQWRALVSVLVTLTVLILILSGVMLFVSPPGRIANWTNWTLLGLRKNEWAGVHVWFSTVFAVVAVVHLILNWRPLVGYFKSKLTHQLAFRKDQLIMGRASMPAAVRPISGRRAWQRQGRKRGTGRGLRFGLQVRPRRILLGAVPVLGESHFAQQRRFRDGRFIHDRHLL